jgi:hypothetical protein
VAVVINEFEVVPEQPTRGREPEQQREQPQPPRQAVARQVEATIRILLSRRARLRAD